MPRVIDQGVSKELAALRRQIHSLRHLVSLLQASDTTNTNALIDVNLTLDAHGLTLIDHETRITDLETP